MKEAINVPAGWHTITPRIMVDEPEQLVEFVKRVFGAIGEYREEAPAEIRIGDSVIMISGTGVRSRTTACLYVYVSDTDATYRHALDAGASSIEEPAVMPYGDRRCIVEDKWGNTWQIATYVLPGRR